MRASDAGPGWDRFEGGRNRNWDRTPSSVRTGRDSRAYGVVGPKESGAVAVGGAGRGGGGVPVSVSVHPQAIDLSQLDAPTTGTSGPGPITGTLLAWCAAIPTLWTAAMIVLSVNVRF